MRDIRKWAEQTVTWKNWPDWKREEVLKDQRKHLYVVRVSRWNRLRRHAH